MTASCSRWRVNAALLISLVLSSCSSIYADRCADEGNASRKPFDLTGCDEGWLSPLTQRASVYEGDDSPRLWTGEAPRTRANIDTSTLNARPGQSRRVTALGQGQGSTVNTGESAIAYYDAQQVSYPADAKTQEADIASVRSMVGSRYDPDEEIQVNFQNDKLEYFLDQMLHGALGVNYIAPPGLDGPVTFRTSRPLPKRYVLQVVRDVLSRNGLEMRYMNGVYQIGPPDSVASVGQISASGRTGERETRLVRISKGKASELVSFVKQLVPDDVTLAVNGGDKILVHAYAADIDRVAELITSLSEGGFGEDRIAVIQLHSGSPEYVAGKLNEFYRARLNGGAGGEVPTILPLENQRAILVGSKDRRVLDAIKVLAARFDTGSGGVEDISLRVVTLRNLAADEVAQQLNLIFNAGGANRVANGGAGRAANGQGTSTNPSGTGQGSTSPTVPANPLNLLGASPPQAGEGVPGFNLGARTTADNTQDTNSAQEQGSATRPGGSAAASGQAGGPVATKIVADVRNNSLLIYSSYALFLRISEVIRALDVPQSQVVIEATIAEVDLNDTLQHGVQAFLSSTGITARSSTDGDPITASSTQGTYGAGAGAVVHLGGTVGNYSADVILSALQTVTTTKVISTPYLTVLDGKTARLVIGDQIPFASTTQNATITGTVTVTQQIVVKDTGIILEVTPKIKADNSALLNIDQQISAAQANPANGTTDLTPTIATQEIKSDILVQSGRTILLGGLIKDSVQKTDGGIPVAMNLPIIGDLFKQHSDTAIRQELIVMITPRVIRHASQVENIARMLRGLVKIR